MKRLLFLAAAGLAVVALAGAVGLPDLAGAQDAPDADETVTASGVGIATAVPNEAQMSFGVESRAPTARRRSPPMPTQCAGDQRAAPSARARGRDPVGERLADHPRRPDDRRLHGVEQRLAVSDVGDEAR